jgi:hypothetical protein
MRAAGLLLISLIVAGVPRLCEAQLQDENLLVKVPPGYKLATEARKAGIVLTEMIPENEDIDHWTEMVTTQVFRGKVVKDIAPFEASVKHQWLSSCPKGGVAPIRAAREHGSEVRLWLQSCPNNPATGRPEFTIFKAIAGDDSFYVIQKAFRFLPSQQQIHPWMLFLRDVVVCDSRLPDHPCPVVKTKDDQDSH